MNVVNMVFAFFATSALAAAPVPLEVQGVPLGATVAQLQQAIPLFKCYGATCTFDPQDAAQAQCGRVSVDPAVLDCYARSGSRYAFGPVRGAKYSAFLKDGRVGELRVTFPVAHADEVVIAMTEKYGKPADDRQFESQTRLGERYGDRVVAWNLPDGSITVERRSVDVDTGSATFIATWYAKATANSKEIAVKSDPAGL